MSAERKQRESAIRTELQRLAEVHGGELQPRVVVEAARDEDSPLHHSFTWDDTKAAEAWRLHQARQMITAVVTYERVGRSLVPVQVFVSLSPDREREGGGYRLVHQVMSDETQRQQMLADAVAEMTRFREKYRRVRELSKVFEAMLEVQLQLDEGEAATDGEGITAQA